MGVTRTRRSFASIALAGSLLVVSACQGASAPASGVASAPPSAAVSPGSPVIAASPAPQNAVELANVDVLRAQIKAYYGDPTGTGVVGADSSYARAASAVAAAGTRWLTEGWTGRAQSGMKAIVLDVDDTSLVTWNLVVASNWDLVPATAAAYAVGERFPAVPGMAAMVNGAADAGYAFFIITGRPPELEAATLGNLTGSDSVGLNAGYPSPTTLANGEDGLFTRPAIGDYPPYLRIACAAELSAGTACTTIEYKTATRAHIESLGYVIAASFGDQQSDLTGGYAARTFKLPNPNYFLP